MPNLPPVKVFWYVPPVMMAARVNMPGTITYPIQDIAFDGVTTGAYTDCQADMFFTLGSAAGLDDYGRGRLRAVPTSTTLKVGRSSQGVEDGELTVVDNAYITVYLDYRVHAKISTIQNYIEYKDTDIAVGDLTEEPPPIANAGADYAGSIDADTETVTVFFPGSNSMAVADGATITGWAWDAPGGTFVSGTDADDDDVYIEFEAGVYIVSLTVTDSNGKTNTTRRMVLADDPDDTLCIPVKGVSIARDRRGASAQFEPIIALPRSTFPDGGKILIWEDRDPTIFGEPSPASRDHMLFTGWHQTDQASSRASETHLVRETRLTCVDVLGRLDSLPGLAQRIEVPTEDDLTEAGMNWGYMPAANMDKYLCYLLHWHSTAGGVADFYPTGTWDEYPFVLFDSGGGTLYEQLNRQANRIVPDYNFTSDRFGAMRVVPDPNLQPVADRTGVTNSLTFQGVSGFEFGYQRPPRVHTTRGSALQTQTEWEIDDDDEKQLLTPLFAIAPGTAPGQGGREATIGERLAKSQADLNDCIGQHHARSNARYGDITATLNSNSDPWDFDPAAHTWVELIIPNIYAPQRGSDFDTVRCLPRELRVDYTISPEAITRRATVTLERETVGLPALTEEQEPALPVGEQPPPYVPPDFGDPDLWYGDMAAYIAWDGAQVGRTWDVQATTPVWENISSGLSGDIYDVQYCMMSANVVGAWLLASSGVWLCANLMASVPSWTNVLPIATVIAADATPSSGTVTVQCMAHYWQQPGHLCVATGPDSAGDYLHAYYWVTTDFGQNWTQVDMNAFTYTSNSITRCYNYSGPFGMACFRSAPTLWCVRTTARTGTSNGRTGVFKSTDGGLTWTQAYEFGNWSAAQGLASILHPFPDLTSPSYIVRAAGNSPGPLDIKLWRSTDAWATATDVTTLPASHGGGYGQRPNQRTFDDDHIINILSISSSSSGDLYESYDRGATWSLLENLNNSKIVPNGWPPDVDQWVLIDRSATPRIQLTLDNFGTFADKTGNIATVFGGWDTSTAGGFALPKVGANT